MSHFHSMTSLMKKLFMTLQMMISNCDRVLLVSVFELGGLVCSPFDRRGSGRSSVAVCKPPFQFAGSGISKN